MEIKVKIPDEILAKAKARGRRVEAYVEEMARLLAEDSKVEAYFEEILAQRLAEHSEGVRRPRTPAEIRAWLDSLAQFSDKIPPLPEVISREWLYQEHN